MSTLKFPFTYSNEIGACRDKGKKKTTSKYGNKSNYIEEENVGEIRLNKF